MKLNMKEKKILYAYACPSHHNTVTRLKWLTALTVDPEAKSQMLHLARKIETETEERWYEAFYHHLRMEMDEYRRIRRSLRALKANCALPGFVDSKNEEKTERNAGYLVVSHSGGGMLRQGTRKGIRRTPANRGMRAHRIVKSLDISEDVCHGMCP